MCLDVSNHHFDTINVKLKGVLTTILNFKGKITIFKFKRFFSFFLLKVSKHVS